MGDYYKVKYELMDAIKLELGTLDPHQLRKVLRYCKTLKAEQPRLFDDSKKCAVCGRVLIKPRRGPWPKFCSDKCRQRNYRKTLPAGM